MQSRVRKSRLLSVTDIYILHTHEYNAGALDRAEGVKSTDVEEVFFGNVLSAK